VEHDQQPYPSQEQDILSSFDLEKFKLILRKSWVYIALFLMASCSLAYLYVRYTKPLYESSSVVKLNFESEASMLNISSPVMKQEGEISGEIELLKSPLFFSKVVDAVDMDVSYFRYGRLLDDERYGINPFAVSYKVKNAAYFNRPIDINILDDQRFELAYDNIRNVYRFGEDIVTAEFNLLLQKTEHLNAQAYGRYYFTINSKEALISYLKSRVQVVPESFTAKTLRISLQDFNRKKAQMLVAAIDSLYEIYTRDAKNKALEQKIAFLDERIKATEGVLQEYDNYFESFILEYRTTNLGTDLSRTITRLEQLDTLHFNLRTQKSDFELLLKQLASNEPLLLNAIFLEQLPTSIRNSLEEYQRLVTDRSLKILSYSENTFIIQKLDDEIALAKTRVTAAVAAYQDRINDQLAMVGSRRALLESSLSQLPSLETQYTKNRRLYSQQEEFMLTLRRAKMEIEITRAGTVTDIVILSPASYPTVPVQPQKALIYGLGVMVGLVFSIVFLLLRYLIDNKVTSISELERLIHVPILGSVPFYKQEKLATTKLIIQPDAKSSLSEALRTIRTNLEFMNGTKDRHVISITSSVSGEGKTFIAVNLGAIIALSGQRVCLVDLDMRKPKIHLAFDTADNTKGISTILAGKTNMQECIRASAIDGLHYLTAGPIPPNPSELLLGDNFNKLLEELEKEYDTVILDSPPVGLVTDGILVMKKADLQLYVVRSGYTQRTYLKTIQQLKRTNKFDKLTVIFNSLSGSGSYGYGYGHGYGYGYYEDGKKSRTFARTIKSLF
jgi:capsular exopolysaccharide synthesis family protein